MRFYALCLFLFIRFGLPLFPQEAQTAPLTAIEHYLRGRNIEAAGRMEEANLHYDQAIRICQDEVSRKAANSDTYAAITLSLVRQKKYREAVTWGEQGLTLFADDYRIVEAIGEAYFYLYDFDRSLAAMQRYVNALPRGERSSIAYFFIGEIFRLSGKYRRADIAYTTAIRLGPGQVLWWYRLASVRESAGDYQFAVEAYQEALRIDPEHAEARAGLARAQTHVTQ
jgi:tetratricopeptide (TPR) repeat protein